MQVAYSSTKPLWNVTQVAPRKAVQGMIKSDLAPTWRVDLAVTESDSRQFHGDRPFCSTNLKTDQGLEQVIACLKHDVLTADLAQ